MELIKRHSRQKFENLEKKLPKRCSFLKAATADYSAINEYKNKSGKTVFRVEFQPGHARALMEAASAAAINEPLMLTEIDTLTREVSRLKQEVVETKAAHCRMADLVVQRNKEFLEQQGKDPEKKQADGGGAALKDSATRLKKAGTRLKKTPPLQGGLPSLGKKKK